MENTKLNQALQTLNIIHWAITLIPVLFGAITLYLSMTNGLEADPENSQLFFYVSLGTLLVGIPGSTIAFKYMLKENKPKNIKRVSDALAPFQTAHLVRLSLLEVPGLFAVVSAFVTGYLPVLGVLVVSTFLMITAKPTKFKISEAVGVNIEELED